MRAGAALGQAERLEVRCRQAVHGRQDAAGSVILPTLRGPIPKPHGGLAGGDRFGLCPNQANPDPLAKHSLSPREMKAVLAVGLAEGFPRIAAAEVNL